MNRLNLVAALLACLVLFSSGAQASNFKEKKSWVREHFPQFFQKQKAKKRLGAITNKQFKKRVKRKYKSNYHSVPEIDAAGAAISLALLAGVVSIGRERRRKRA